MQQNIAKLIDQTFLKKGSSNEEIKKVCQETREYGFRGLCLLPEHIKLAKELLKDTEIKVITLIDEPTGSSPHEERIEMVKKAKGDGSDEVDVVMKIDDFKNGKYNEVLDDLKEICKILSTKVIIGSGYLTDEEIKKASEIVKTARAICVKTATINDPLDNSELSEKAKHIRIMRESAPGLLVKAAGSIRTLQDLEIMAEAGADIIGTSSGVEIVNEARYQPIIGLETHIELKTESKMFCSSLNNPDEKHPNVHICPICLGHPGTLPVINKDAVRKVAKTGLALNCQIPEYSKFDRKNYFYPDLPKGYQISQYDKPLCVGGFLEMEETKFPSKKIRIRRVHLEEDTGKLIHPEGVDYSLVDFNRAGIPLMELVTEPDIFSAKEARKFAEELQLILRYLDVSDADMEKGQLRVEVNVSLTQALAKGEEKELGTKVEIKNLNSFKAVEKGIEYEIKRQTEILNRKGKIAQETRGWDDIRGETLSQREKEEAYDYRYFPEPDLPPLHFTKKEIDGIRAEIPELPRQRRGRFREEYQLDEKSIEIFVKNKDLGEYYEKAMSELRQWVKEIEMKRKIEEKEFLKLAKFCSNYLISDLQGLLKGVAIDGEDFLITPENFAEFIALIYKGKMSSKIAKMVLLEMFKTGADPSNIIEDKGLTQIIDEKEIEKIVKEVISQNQKTVKDYKLGKETALQYLIGQVMAKSKGKANPQMVNKILNQILIKI